MNKRVEDLLEAWAAFNLFFTPVFLIFLVDHIRVEPSPLLEVLFLQLPATLFFMFAPLVLVDRFYERDSHERCIQD